MSGESRVARCLMVQGTASHVGKSIVAAGLCRLFSDMGYRVAPFKSQNMSLNSCVTGRGEEIARAQELQARGARCEPRVEMNPVLLKPQQEFKCEVILRGRSRGNWTAMEYFREHQPEALRVVGESLAELRRDYDIVVIEGAGSPAEINLRRRDICNMKVAALAEAPVLLLADIDKGGALASVVGTMDLLREKERARVAGIVFNKFRGDFELLRPGLRIVEKKTGVRVLGVIPYLDCSCLDEEDTPRFASSHRAEIAVVHLPYMSNFTDFAPLARLVPLRWATRPEELDGCRAVILPGTRNTVHDLKWLKERGLGERIREMAAQGGLVLGICGGYQMLGERLRDPDGLDGPPGELAGLGLLPVETTFFRPKITLQVRARVMGGAGLLPGLQGSELNGYEIHAGRVARTGGEAPFRFETSEGETEDGAVSSDGRVLGTHLHGLFGNPPALVSFLRRLGLETTQEDPYLRLAEDNLDRLAAAIRESLDMKYLEELVGKA
jgi:adenosylcobyric acid synthase